MNNYWFGLVGRV